MSISDCSVLVHALSHHRLGNGKLESDGITKISVRIPGVALRRNECAYRRQHRWGAHIVFVVGRRFHRFWERALWITRQVTAIRKWVARLSPKWNCLKIGNSFKLEFNLIICEAIFRMMVNGFRRWSIDFGKDAHWFRADSIVCNTEMLVVLFFTYFVL